MWKRQCPSSVPNDVVELILLRLPVESLVRFRSVSKNWKSIIDSPRFQEEQLIHRKQSRGPDFLFIHREHTDEARIVFGSSIFHRVRFPFPNSLVYYGSCDGLVCLFSLSTPNIVLNPATQWHRSFPFSCVQQLMVDSFKKGDFSAPVSKLGFGKDKFSGTYKPVMLSNSSELGLDNVTTCEVFDFSTNAWRFVVPASPYRIIEYQLPVYLDGSLYWFTENKVLSFDLHTETFQVFFEAPFAQVHHPHSVMLCILDNRLCVTQKNWPTQVIWSFESGTWKIMCCIDLTETVFSFGNAQHALTQSVFSFGNYQRALIPAVILENNKLLLYGHKQPFVIHDLHTKSYDILFTPTTIGHCLYYFQSLLSL